MKRKLLFMVAVLLGLPLMAQTEFRHISYEEAVAAAKAENKMLFLDFYTDWCGPCKMMMNNVFPQKVVGDYMNEKFICLKVNPEKSKKEEALADKLNVKAYPTFVILDASEKVIGTKVGGNHNGEAFITEIDLLVDPNKSPERLKARYESGERTADLISAYAAMLNEEAHKTRKADEAKLEQAKAMVTDYFNGLSDAQKLAPENLFIYTDYTESPNESIAQYMIANRDKFDASVKEKVTEQISNLYAMQVYHYLSAPVDNETEYQALKKGIADFGQAEKYAPRFQLIELREAGDMSALLDYCEKEYEHMDDETRLLLMNSMNGLVTSDDEAIHQRVSRFIRSKLEHMSWDALYFAVMQLRNFEGMGH